MDQLHCLTNHLPGSLLNWLDSLLKKLAGAMVHYHFCLPLLLPHFQELGPYFPRFFGMIEKLHRIFTNVA